MDNHRVIEYYYKGVRRSVQNGQWADITDGYIRLKYPGGYKLIVLSDVTKNIDSDIIFDDNTNTIKIGTDHVLKIQSPDIYEKRKNLIQRKLTS